MAYLERPDDAPAPEPPQTSRLDRVINALSPRWGTRRLKDRVQQAMAVSYLGSFGYVGGRFDRTSTQEWGPGAGDANTDFLHQSDTLRARSRDLTRNSPIAAGAVNTSVTHVIGTGLRLHSKVDADFLGLSPEEAEGKQLELERLWRGNCDRLDYEGDVCQQDLQAMVFRGMFESGDILVVRRNRMMDGDMLATKVQLIEADRVQNPQQGMDTEKTAGGVETDGTGRTVAYHVANRHPGDTLLQEITSWARVKKIGRGGVPLSRLIFDKRRPGQRRGVPTLAPVIDPLKQVSRLTDYELTAAVVSSMFTIFVKTDSPNTGGLPVAPEGATVVPDKPGQIFTNPGAVIDLKPGESIETADPKRPNDSFSPFFTAMVQQIGMAIEVPYSVLMHLYADSYSAARAAMLDGWRFFQTRRKFIADNFLDLVYLWVVMDAVSSGIIDLPGFLTSPFAQRAWLGTNWIGDAQAQINPEDMANAAMTRIDGGLSNRKIETAAIMGLDWATQVQPQREREKKRLDAAEMPFATKSAPATSEPEEEEVPPAGREADGSPLEKRDPQSGRKRRTA